MILLSFRLGNNLRTAMQTAFHIIINKKVDSYIWNIFIDLNNYDSESRFATLKKRRSML